MVHTLLELQKHEHTTCPSLRDYAFNFNTVLQLRDTITFLVPQEAPLGTRPGCVLLGPL